MKTLITLLISLFSIQSLALSQDCKTAMLGANGGSNNVSLSYDLLTIYGNDFHSVSIIDSDNPHLDLKISLFYMNEPYFNNSCTEQELSSFTLKNCKESDILYSCDAEFYDTEIFDNFTIKMTNVEDQEISLLISQPALASERYNIGHDGGWGFEDRKESLKKLYERSMKEEGVFYNSFVSILLQTVERFDLDAENPFEDLSVDFDQITTTVDVNAEEIYFTEGVIPVCLSNPKTVSWSHKELIGYIRFSDDADVMWERQIFSFEDIRYLEAPILD
ncbi:MAG: hypothetical protein MJK18_09400 [Bdellovibrionales bacterium]|nr:hypothetical protein [Bdellovibrionales bacterium]